jgi:uncharacterized coiled-coil protein SlyX
MADPLKLLALEELRCELAEKSRLLSELDVMLADYQAERNRLIRDLRRLQARLRDVEEQLPSEPNDIPEP